MISKCCPQIFTQKAIPLFNLLAKSPNPTKSNACFRKKNAPVPIPITKPLYGKKTFRRYKTTTNY